MKKLFTLTTLALATLSASATDYTDNLKVTLAGTSTDQSATISVVQNADNTYTLTLQDFSLSMGGNTVDVGNIVIAGAKAVEKDGIKGFAKADTITITAGSDPSKNWMGPLLGNVPLKLSAEFTNSQLYSVINISMSDMDIAVQFGNRFSETFYQAQNSDFEVFVGSGKTFEPKYWHSFGSAGGNFANFVNGKQKVFQSSDTRPGSAGSSSVKIISTSALFGIIANGNLTTGRVMAGSTSASSTANNNLSNPNSPNVDQSGVPFVQPFFGRPDSLVVWAKFVPGSSAPATAKASIRAVIHDNTKYQNPEEQAYTNVVAKAVALTPNTNNQWVRLTVPFVYENNDVVPANILFSISTNENPGSGSGSDELYIDDIQLIYNTQETTTGVSRIAVATTPIESGVYSLDGRRVSTPKAGSLYIVKEAGKPARKVLY